MIKHYVQRGAIVTASLQPDGRMRIVNSLGTSTTLEADRFERLFAELPAGVLEEEFPKDEVPEPQPSRPGGPTQR